MKLYLVMLTGFITVFNSSCNLGFFKTKYPITERPEICNKVFSNPPINSEKLRGYSVEELLTLQKCGLEYYPEHQLQWDIANHNEYPIPEIIRRLRTDKDEYYQHYLILDIESLTRSKNHKEKNLTDKNLLLDEIGGAISKMQDEDIKEISQNEFIKIKEFFSKR